MKILGPILHLRRWRLTNWAVGLFLIYLGVRSWVYLLSLGLAPWPAFTIDYVTFMPDILPVGVTPVSLIIIGIGLLGLDRHGGRAIPLTLMVCGAFDFFLHGPLFPRVTTDFWGSFQVALILIGWLAAGAPRFKLSGIPFALVATTWILGIDYHLFLVALFFFVRQCMMPESMLEWLKPRAPDLKGGETGSPLRACPQVRSIWPSSGAWGRAPASNATSKSQWSAGG